MSKKIIDNHKRILETEEGWTVKPGASLRIALCYPNTHSIGMANLGMHTMYELFNTSPRFRANACSVRKIRSTGNAIALNTNADRMFYLLRELFTDFADTKILKLKYLL